MLRNSSLGNPFALPTPTGRVLYPAAAALLTVLTAVTVCLALPQAWQASDAALDLTGGGKFAARIPGGARDPEDRPAAVTPVLRLPTLVQPVERATVAWLSATTDGLWSRMPRAQAVLERHQKLKGRPDVRRVAAVAVVQPKTVVPLVETTPARTDDGLMTKMLSPARSVWSLTASAGGSVLSHILPQ